MISRQSARWTRQRRRYFLRRMHPWCSCAAEKRRNWHRHRPHNKYLGVMLPCTPLHHVLLAESGRPLVMTSGNISEEPIARDNDEAGQRLAVLQTIFSCTIATSIPGTMTVSMLSLRTRLTPYAGLAATHRIPSSCPSGPSPYWRWRPGEKHVLSDPRRIRLCKPAHRRPGHHRHAGALQVNR